MAFAAARKDALFVRYLDTRPRTRSHSYLIIYQRDTSDPRIIAFEREISNGIVSLSDVDGVLSEENGKKSDFNPWWKQAERQRECFIVFQL